MHIFIRWVKNVWFDNVVRGLVKLNQEESNYNDAYEITHFGQNTVQEWWTEYWAIRLTSEYKIQLIKLIDRPSNKSKLWLNIIYNK